MCHSTYHHGDAVFFIGSLHSGLAAGRLDLPEQTNLGNWTVCSLRIRIGLLKSLDKSGVCGFKRNTNKDRGTTFVKSGYIVSHANTNKNRGTAFVEPLPDLREAQERLTPTEIEVFLTSAQARDN